MRVRAALIFGAMLSLQASAVFAQVNPYSLSVDIFLDENADSVYQEAEARIGDWPIQVFDPAFQPLASILASSDDTTTIELTEQPSYVCLGPAAGFIQTSPLAGTPHPDDPAWMCQDVIETYAFRFLLAQEPNQPEELPELLDESNTPPVEKDPVEAEEQGAVLGETSPEVLAETGAETWLPMLVGSALILGTLALARPQQID